MAQQHLERGLEDELIYESRSMLRFGFLICLIICSIVMTMASSTACFTVRKLSLIADVMNTPPLCPKSSN